MQGFGVTVAATWPSAHRYRSVHAPAHGRRCAPALRRDRGRRGPCPPPACLSHITVTPVDYTLQQLCKMIESREIVLPPDARGPAWGVHAASRLIESFLLGVPVPPVFLLEREDRSMLVVDGRQRLLAVRGFFSERLEGAEGGPAKCSGLSASPAFCAGGRSRPWTRATGARSRMRSCGRS